MVLFKPIVLIYNMWGIIMKNNIFYIILIKLRWKQRDIILCKLEMFKNDI